MFKTKYSGVEWIGDIPIEWNIDKLKYCVDEINSGGTPESSNMDYYDDLTGIPWVAIGDMSTKEYVYDTSKKITIEGIKNKNLKIYPSGTLLYSIFATIGKTSFLKVNATINQAILAIIANKKIDKSFLKYQLNAMEDYVLSECSTNTQNNLNSTKVKNFNLVLPKLNEQKLIANFLDEKTTNLNNILFDLNKQIELLTSYKKSIITETVIGGLNKNVKMVASGFNWAKEVPAHWDVTKKIKSLFDFSNGLPITKADLIENGIPVISYGQIHSKTNKGTFINSSLIRFVDEKYLKQNKSSIVKEGDFIFADTSEDIDGCGNCVYVDTNELLFAGYHSIILRSKYSNQNKYLAYLFLTDNWRSQIRSKVYGVKVFSVTQKILKEAKIILPPENEQKEIVEYLDKKCEQIDKIIEEKQKQIEKIEEYKKSVIYEYVTGKKRVEGAEELYG